MAMNKSTQLLHETLIRLAKGMISAWEKWLKDGQAA
jgi:hypothetical protein